MILQLIKRSKFYRTFCAWVDVFLTMNGFTMNFHLTASFELHATEIARKSPNIGMSKLYMRSQKILEDESFLAMIACELFFRLRVRYLLMRS